MSSGSYDESSNLVPGLVSPPGGEKEDDVFDKIDQDLSEHSPEDFPTLREKSKKSKGLKHLLKPSNKKRSKSPLRAILKSPSKSRAKTHATSPSEENLFRKFAEEPTENGEKEKQKSEEWQAFQQMQDRIKETVVKTQSTLHKLASESSDDIPKRKRGADGRWVGFCDEQLIPDNGNQGVDGEDISSYEDNLSFSENNRNLSGLTDSPAYSPKIPPKPPANSLRNSTENLVASQAENMAGQGQYADLLGLSDDIGSGSESTANVVNQDLLGLDDFMSSTPPQHVPSEHSAMSQWMVESDPTSHVQQSAYRDSPITFEQELLGGCDQQVPQESSGFIDPLMEEFLHDAAAEQAKSSTAQSNLIDDFLNDNVPEKTNVSSILSDEYLMSKEMTTDVENDPFVVKLDTSTSEQLGVHDDDPFTVPSTVIPTSDQLDTQVISVQPKNVIGDDFDPFATIIGDDSFIDPRKQTPKVQIITTDDDFKMKDQQDFMEQSQDIFGFQDNQRMSGSSPNPFAEAVDGKSNLFDEDFFENIPEESGLVNKDSTWGGISSDNTVSQSANPFQEDFFSAEQIPERPADDIFTKNPFLTDNLDPVAVNQNLFLSVDRGSKVFDIDTVEGEDISFDPFNTSKTVKQDNTTDGTDDLDLFTSLASRGDDQLVQPGDDDADDENFMIDIKPKKNTSSLGAAPALPPPPPVSHSPLKASRENPFDKESPPEEDFAKFPVPEEGETHAPPVQSRSFSTDTSLSEEDESNEPLPQFLPDYNKEGWKLMLRYPTKKKITSNRHWKTVFVRIAKQKDGIVIKLYHDENERDSFQELLLQPCYSLSEIALQQYDQFGKIHTVKLQYIFYRERVGIRPERITPSFVRKPKPTMILDHAPQVSELLKFGGLDRYELQTFVYEIEDALFRMESHREKTLTYTKDEVTVEVWDEYVAHIDKEGHILMQKARVRAFILAFVTGMPTCELGLNDRRRKGKEVVGRHDIIPVKTEEWIKLQNVEFHCSVNVDEFEKTNNIKFRPLDACQFELLRFPCRPKENKELPLQLSIQQILKGRHFEVRCDLLVTGYHAYSKKHGQYPCEDIEIQVQIPEPWIYLFRYERRFGYGSFKSAFRKPGKIKGLERITMLTQGLLPPTLMEASVGTAKYEHVYKAVVWRVPRLPERNQGAYTNHLFILKLDLGQHDEIPTTFTQHAKVYFTMPASSVSKCQARSISVDHPNPPEKWVRYLAKYEYKVDVDTIIQSGDSLEDESSD